MKTALVTAGNLCYYYNVLINVFIKVGGDQNHVFVYLIFSGHQLAKKFVFPTQNLCQSQINEGED